MLKGFLNLFRTVVTPVPDEFEFTVKALPSFPSFKVSIEDRWRHINENKLLQRLVGEGKIPSHEINKMFTCSNKLDICMDSECYPTYSDLTFYIKRIKDK